MGIGYIIPEGVDKAAFKAEYAKWEQKLKNSGFTDIEYRSPSQSGHFTPFFRENGSTATFMRLYDPAKEEYYALARSFNAYMNEYYPGSNCNRWGVYFRGNVLMYKTLWYLHIEGVPYRAVAKAFSGKESKWLEGVKPVPAKLVQPRSVFWAHDKTSHILDLFWKWAKQNHSFDDPRDSYVSRKLTKQQKLERLKP